MLIIFLIDITLDDRISLHSIQKQDAYMRNMSILSIFISKLLPPMPFNFEMKKRKQIYKRESNDLIQSRI